MQVKVRRRIGLGLVGLVTMAGIWGFTQPLPYVIVQPGDAHNVLGSEAGKPLVQVKNSPDEQLFGSLDLLTVAVYGSPGNTPNLLDLVEAYFSEQQIIAPLEQFYPLGISRAEAVAKDAQLFEDSKSAAILAAKSELPPEISEKLEVQFNLDDIGGPSGGLMFALGIIEKATPGSLTSGKRIAGTGTISARGVVGAIGGIDFKMLSAAEVGDRYFFAPKDNCSQVLGHIPKGLRVIPVANLHEALAALKVIAADGNIESLPVCTAG